MADEAAQETAPVEIDEAAPADVPNGADQTVETEATTEPAPAGEETQTEAPVDGEDRVYTKAEVKKLKDEAQKLRARLKEETAAAAERASKEASEAAEKALIERLGKELGLIQDDEPVDPQVLLDQLAEEKAAVANERDAYRQQIAAFKAEQALTKAANAVDGDLDILTPYLRGTGALDALDPDAEDYPAQVAAVVASAVEANPKLKKVAPVAAPARSGGDINAGSGIQKKGPSSIDDIRAAIRNKRER
ncbi:hypothetical protein QNA24_30295 [Rhodococcus qingshengii]|uniref:hypothetical protein n=1 Tax=Rhodococcus TaxID=1827 RepID=UPI001E44D933|nr:MULTISPECIES: hypothetical protein [Rhodococcus]MCD2099541.1 hypothetical protein [Rhodococcus rhodochrous]MCD2123909.1 hypothetical protein [Rhodococcus rhodochrous]MCQ4136664.1 hypothetical protein [Rhodococcus rhodochrous]MDJ0490675.1 hypothetical protein [Rhodococcus qingshengii]